MIDVSHVIKRFGLRTAVDAVSFHVSPGEVLGFLGPNGAGKTTTMRLITGFLEPDSGFVKVGGFDPGKQPVEARRLLGYLPENAPAYEDMTVEEYLGFVAALRGARGATLRQQVSRVIERCFLSPVRRQTLETLSRGFRQRTCLAQAVVHDPPVLILDEPTEGLDPNQKKVVRDMIVEMGRDKAIILSTHILEEVDVVCSRVIIICNGRLVANGTPTELKAMDPENHRLDTVFGKLTRRAGIGPVSENPEPGR